jgi:hypothetical protein
MRTAVRAQRIVRTEKKRVGEAREVPLLPLRVLPLAVVCLAAWSALLQGLANASGFFFQAELYNTTPTEITYAVGSLSD